MLTRRNLKFNFTWFHLGTIMEHSDWRSMGLENCPQCGKVFNRTTRTLCPSCFDREQDVFDRVSEYVYAHADAEAHEVLEHTGIQQADLESLLKRGRLLGFERLAASVLRCQRCNEAVTRGPYCLRCAAEIKAGAAPPDPPPQPTAPAPAKTNHSSRRDPSHGNRSEYWRSRVNH